MKKISIFCMSLLLGCSFAAPAQTAPNRQQEAKPEVFRNPAMEEQDEFQQALNKGRFLLREGEPEEAIKQFRKAATLKNGQCLECLQFIAQASFAIGKYKDAADAYRQAVALKPANEANLYLSLGVCLYVQKDKKLLEEAVAAFNQAIELSGGKLVKAYHNLGYALIRLGREAEGKAALTKYLEVDPNTSSIIEVRAIIANPKMVNESFAPGFKVKSMTGEDISLDKYHGKIVMLDFWATWCGPCREEMPHVKNMWAKFGGDQFVIIGVSQDHNIKALENYVKQENITWPQFFDETGELAQRYGVSSIPFTVLIDQDGLIKAVGFRGVSLTARIEELLKKARKQSSAAEKSRASVR